jgi:hypothetical protein
MMCGCGRPAGPPAVPRTATAATPAAAPARSGVALRYRGARAVLVRGPATGVGYACHPGDTLVVDARDAPALVASGVFVRPAP